MFCTPTRNSRSVCSGAWCMPRVSFLLCLAALQVCTPAAHAAKRLKASWQGVVSYVVDGDTVHVRPAGGGKPVSVRIQGIDAPEICQAAGAASRDALTQLALGQPVQVHGEHHDDYGRVLATIEVHGEDVGQVMVARGLAWSYRYRGQGGAYAVQQRQARAAGLGMFSSAYAQPPMYPAAFRRQHGSCYLQSSAPRQGARRKKSGNTGRAARIGRIEKGFRH